MWGKRSFLSISLMSTFFSSFSCSIWLSFAANWLSLSPICCFFCWSSWFLAFSWLRKDSFSCVKAAICWSFWVASSLNRVTLAVLFRSPFLIDSLQKCFLKNKSFSGMFIKFRVSRRPFKHLEILSRLIGIRQLKKRA